jgi:hypothetical protein
VILNAARAARVEDEVAHRAGSSCKSPLNPNRPLLAPQRHKPDRKLVATLLAERLSELPPDSIRRRVILVMLGYGEVSP